MRSPLDFSTGRLRALDPAKIPSEGHVDAGIQVPCIPDVEGESRVDRSEEQLFFHPEAGIRRVINGLQFRQGTSAGHYNPGQAKEEKDNEEKVSCHEPDAVGIAKPSELRHYQCI